MAASSQLEQRVREDACERHGSFRSQLLRGGAYGRPDRWSSCPTCLAEETERRRLADQEARLQERQAKWLEQSGLRGRFARATFSTFTAATAKQAAVLKACRAWIQSVDLAAWSTLWLIGPPGTGKSHLGAAIAQACIGVRHRPAGVATPREIVRELRATWRRDAEDREEDVIEDYSGVPLLVLDEVGVGFGTDGELVQLFEVIDRRYQLGHPVVLISNLAAPELRTALGDRIFDRMREGAVVLVCDWPSHRGATEAKR